MTSLDLFAVAFMVTVVTPAALCMVQKTVGGVPLTLNPETINNQRNIFILVIIVLYRTMVKSKPVQLNPELEIPLPPRKKAPKPKGRRVLVPCEQVTKRQLLAIVLIVFLVEERRHERAANPQKLLEGPRQPKLLGFDPLAPFWLSDADKLDYHYSIQEELEAKSLVPVVLDYKKPRKRNNPKKDVRHKKGMLRRVASGRTKGVWL